MHWMQRGKQHVSKAFIDFSQYYAFEKCEAFWAEIYLHQMRKASPPGQRSDPMTLGTLVHAGLQALRESGTLDIPAHAIASANASPECLGVARALLSGYVRRYPQEEFKDFACEEPLRFPLDAPLDGLAKVDYYFEVREPTTLSSGLGDSFVLDPGWWVKEYKTKDSTRDRGRYAEGWRVGMQASFQMLALRERLGEAPRGVLIDVLEKPRVYEPVRTCKTCKTKSEYRDWEPTGDGFACPGCRVIQALAPPQETAPRVPDYYRIMVSRGVEALAWSKEQIEARAKRMYEIGIGQAQALHATERCVDGIFGRCEYFEPHTAMRPATGASGFVSVDGLAYVKERTSNE